MMAFKSKKIADTELPKSRIDYLDNIIKEVYLKTLINKAYLDDRPSLDKIKERVRATRCEWTVNYLLQNYDISVKDIKYIAQCSVSTIVIELFRLGTPIKSIKHKTALTINKLNGIFFHYCKFFNDDSDTSIQNFYFKEFEKSQINELKDEVTELKNIVKEMAEILKEFTGITKEKTTPAPTCSYTQEEL